MRFASILVTSFFALLITLSGCSVTNPLAGVGVEGSRHGGWGVDRSADATPATVESADEERSEAASGEPERVEAPTPPRTSEGRTSASSSSTTPAERPTAAAPARSPAPAATPATTVEAGYDATIRRISFAERSDGRGLVVRLHSTGRISAFQTRETADGSISLSLFQTEVTAAEPSAPNPIRGVNIDQNGSRAEVRLEIDPDVFVVPEAYHDRDSDDLLLSLTYARRPEIASASSVSSSTVATTSASSEHWRLDCIVVDAGHGGRDPGAVHNGVRESDVNLAISLRLGRMLEENLGVRVVYTRTDDRFIELEERGRIANQSCGKLFVSIHANSASNRSAQGTETYFLGVHRTESARRVMERENSVIALESDPTLYSGRTEAALIMQTMAQSTYLRISESLAGLIEGQFSGHADRRSRGVKQAGFLVLWGASMPAVLVETGFISNPEEARFLASSRGQEAIASSIYRAIREYKERYEQGLGIAHN